MSYAIRVHEYGGPEVLKPENVEVGDPGPGEIKIKQAAVAQLYRHLSAERTLSATVVSIHPGHGRRRRGHGARRGRARPQGRRHVAYAGLIGAYAEERLIAADRVVKIPAGVDDKIAAAIMSKA